MATEWLEWKAHEGGIFIRHQMNNTEKRIGERRLPVDGFHGPSQTVFQFHGCWWHGHNCYLTKGKEMNEKRMKPMAELREETTANSKYIRDQGYNLVDMWGCQWRRMKKLTPWPPPDPGSKSDHKSYQRRVSLWCCRVWHHSTWPSETQVLRNVSNLQKYADF